MEVMHSDYSHDKIEEWAKKMLEDMTTDSNEEAENDGKTT